VESIKKIINLKDFTEKFGKKELCINTPEEYSGISYGYIPYDIVVNEDSPAVIKNMPFYTGAYGLTNAVKYHTFANYYIWLRRFIMESKYYTPSKRRTDTFWNETGSTLNYKEPNGGKYGVFVSSEAVLSEIPDDLSGFTCGESIICVNESADTFFERYLNVADAVEFLEYAENNIFNGEGYDVAEPFADFSFLINEEIDEMGAEYMCWPETWEDYVANNIVAELYAYWIYKGVFVIFKGDVYSANGTFFSEERTGATKVLVSASEYLNSPYNSRFWAKCSFLDSTLVTTSFTESKLSTLVRQKESVDDNGNKLDFVFNQISFNCDLIYVTGVPYNSVYDDKIGAYKYDVINEITCTKSNGEPQDIFSILTSDVGTTGRIYFRYIIGNMLTGNTDAQICTNEEGGGIVYEETYNYSVKNKQFRFNSSDYTLPYIDIDYSSGEKPENAIPGELYAKIYITNTEEETISANTFIRHDEMIGVENAEFNASKIKIDRGSAASYEAFNVLSEVNSLDDIENYHDDWFRIKGKND